MQIILFGSYTVHNYYLYQECKQVHFGWSILNSPELFNQLNIVVI